MVVSGSQLAQRRAFGYQFRPPTLSSVQRQETFMYLMLSKKPRKANRTKTGRYRAKLKAKDRNRRNRVYQKV